MSFTVCITANDEGTFTVSVESPQEEAAEQPMGQPAAQPPAQAAPEETPEAGQTVGTVKEALTLALDALKNGGKMAGDQQAQAFNAAVQGKGEY